MRVLPLVACVLLLLSAQPVFAQSMEAFDMEGKGNQLPSTDEYKNVPEGLLLPPEVAEKLAEESGKDIGLGSRSRKMNYDKIQEMYNQGMFNEVFANVKTLAEGGHHGAEELLGVMFRLGQGTPTDALKAFDYLTKAAEENRPLAQHHLGVMYYLGEGVPQPDSVTALMWLHIAIVHYKDGPEKDRAKQDRDNIYPLLTRREKDRAMELARTWLTKKGEAHLLDLER